MARTERKGLFGFRKRKIAKDSGKPKPPKVEIDFEERVERDAENEVVSFEEDTKDWDEEGKYYWCHQYEEPGPVYGHPVSTLNDEDYVTENDPMALAAGIAGEIMVNLEKDTKSVTKSLKKEVNQVLEGERSWYDVLKQSCKACATCVKPDLPLDTTMDISRSDDSILSGESSQEAKLSEHHVQPWQLEPGFDSARYVEMEKRSEEKDGGLIEI